MARKYEVVFPCPRERLDTLGHVMIAASYDDDCTVGITLSNLSAQFANELEDTLRHWGFKPLIVPAAATPREVDIRDALLPAAS
jgi:hypothetical protein